MIYKLIRLGLLLPVMLTACAGSTRNPTAKVPATVPSDSYPGPGNANQGVAPDQSGAYPAPSGQNPAQASPYPQPGEGGTNPYAPAAGDEKLTRGNAFPDLKTSSLIIKESMPMQISIDLKGDLPTPCHQLRVNPKRDDTQKRIDLEVYSVVDPAKVCAQVLEPFAVQIPLGSYAEEYAVYINGELLNK